MQFRMKFDAYHSFRTEYMQKLPRPEPRELYYTENYSAVVMVMRPEPFTSE